MIKLFITCLSLSCPERKGGKCNAHNMNTNKQIEEIVKEFRINFGSLHHQVCNRDMTLDEMVEWLEPTLTTALEEREREIKQIVIEDVPHQYQGRLLALLTKDSKGE